LRCFSLTDLTLKIIGGFNHPSGCYEMLMSKSLSFYFLLVFCVQVQDSSGASKWQTKQKQPIYYASIGIYLFMMWIYSSVQ